MASAAEHTKDKDNSKDKDHDGSTHYLSQARGSEDKILKKRGYRLTKQLGEGSYAKVYMAEYTDKTEEDHEAKRVHLACKVINGDTAPADFLKRFFPRELEIMSRVNHPHLIRVHSILQRKNRYFIFMQFCDNGDVLDFIRKHGAIKEKQARIWFSQILRGLHYMHERHIVHRDMKCENILLTHSYNVKISDFGFARYLIPPDVKSETFCGSVSYAAPEIIRGHPYDPKGADVWSTGVILYVMLNKAMPFDDSSLKGMYVSQMQRTWKFRSSIKDVLSQEVKKFVYVILDPDVESRPNPEKIWEEAWIQKSPDIIVTITGEPRANLVKTKSTKSIQKGGVPVHAASIRKPGPAPTLDRPVRIMEAETAQLNPPSYYFPDYRTASESPKPIVGIKAPVSAVVVQQTTSTTSAVTAESDPSSSKNINKLVQSKGVLDGLFDDSKKPPAPTT